MTHKKNLWPGDVAQTDTVAASQCTSQRGQPVPFTVKACQQHTGMMVYEIQGLPHSTSRYQTTDVKVHQHDKDKGSDTEHNVNYDFLVRCVNNR